MESFTKHHSLEPGKYYYLTNYGDFRNELKYNQGVMVIPAADSIIITDTMQFNSISKDTIITIQEGTTWVIAPKEKLSCVSDTTHSHYMFAYVEVSSQKVVAHKTKLLDKEKGIYEVQAKIKHYPKPYWLEMEDWKQDKPLKILDRMKMPVYEDEKGTHFIVFYKGTYSELREMLCCGGKIKPASTQQIIHAINQLGYNVTTTDSNTFSPELKTALIHFQKKNGLPVGNLNMETLRALGLQY